ncbi:MAG: ABC transporter permease subunit [Coriobacteriia bacterium]|nr:ABC transporter permease subunit [Coriobacteriia bacterium]
MAGTTRRRPAARLALSASLAAVLIAFAVTPAFALTGAKVTLDQETGGQPTRFTFVAVTDKDASIGDMGITFPANFDLSKSRYKVVTLEGLKRNPIEVSGVAKAETLALKFAPSIPANSTLRIEVFDVVPPNEGGTFKLDLAYSAETSAAGTPAVEQRTGSTTSFSYVTPPTHEIISRWLDQQPAVTSYNNIKALGMFFKPQLIVRSIPFLFMGWLLAISLVLLGFPLAIAGGLGLAFMKMSKIAPVRWVAAIYINVIRGTPLFLQIMVAFIGLRIAGLRTSDFVTAVFVLAINSSAYLAEIFRAGIQSIHKGQFEAASSLGMTYRQSMQYVIIPQTVKRVLPTMTSEFILLFKDTALFAAVGLGELMYGAQNIVANTGNLTAFVVAAVYYLIVTIPLIYFVGNLEAKLAVSEHGHTPPEPKKRRRGAFFDAVAQSNDPYRAKAPDSIHDDNEGGR